jgi:hypothetical protein
MSVKLLEVLLRPAASRCFCSISNTLKKSSLNRSTTLSVASISLCVGYFLDDVGMPTGLEPYARADIKRLLVELGNFV